MFIFIYALASQILNDKNQAGKFETSNGNYKVINLEDIESDIAEFKSLDPSSNLKTEKYTDISQKLNFLEDQ